MDFTTSLDKGGFAPLYKNMVKSMALLVWKTKGIIVLMKRQSQNKTKIGTTLIMAPPMLIMASPTHAN